MALVAGSRSLASVSRQCKFSSPPNHHFNHRHKIANLSARVATPISRPASDWTAREDSTTTTSVRHAMGDKYFMNGDTRPVILFDGICNMCNAGVNFVLDFDKRGVFRFAALQSDAGRALLQRAGRDPDDISSIVLVSKTGSWIKSTAVLKIAEGLDMPFRVASALAQIFPGGFRDGVYCWVADNRYKIMGERESCRLMQPEWRDRFLV